MDKNNTDPTKDIKVPSGPPLHVDPNNNWFTEADSKVKGTDNPLGRTLAIYALRQAALTTAVVFTNAQIRTAWSQSDLSHLQLISTNKNYRALPRKMWESILALHLTLHPYETDFFDCDVFSAVFAGFIPWNFDVNGVVRILDISGKHSYNAVLVVSDDKKTCSWIRVEPQKDIFIEHPNQGLTVTSLNGDYSATYGMAITV